MGFSLVIFFLEKKVVNIWKSKKILLAIFFLSWIAAFFYLKDGKIYKRHLFLKSNMILENITQRKASDRDAIFNLAINYLKRKNNYLWGVGAGRVSEFYAAVWSDFIREGSNLLSSLLQILEINDLELLKKWNYYLLGNKKDLLVLKHTHNIFLQYWMNLGLGGILSLVYFLFVFLWTNVSFWKNIFFHYRGKFFNFYFQVSVLTFISILIEIDKNCWDYLFYGSGYSFLFWVLVFLNLFSIQEFSKDKMGLKKMEYVKK